MNTPLSAGQAQQPAAKFANFTFIGLVVLALALVARLALLEVTDLMDPTEARYATIAQEMVRSGDWLTPKLPMPGGIEPYLGKPPLHFWMTAVSYSLFGVEEWTSRLPSFVSALVILGCVWAFARRFFSSEIATLSLLFTASSGLFFFLSGASVVDVTLGATVSLALTFAAFFAAQPERKRYALLGSAALALGFLTKGPVAIALFAVPMGLWIAIAGEWRLLKRVPWVSSLSVFLAVTAPWFILSEQANPGFLKYFFWNENIARYLLKDYGDRYGSGHRYVRGTVWLVLFAAFMPWTLLFPFSLKGKGVRGLARRIRDDRPLLFALFWGLSPAIFFTFVRQLQPGYVIPGIPGLAIALAQLQSERLKEGGLCGHAAVLRRFSRFAAGIATLVILAQLMHGVSLSVLAGLLVALAASLIVTRRTIWNGVGESLLGANATMLALLVAAVLAVTPQVNERQSTEQILRRAVAEIPEPSPQIAVVTQNTFSHYWLSEAEADELGKHVSIVYVDPEKLADSPYRHLLIKRKDLKDLPAAAVAEFETVCDGGSWTYLRRKSLSAQAAIPSNGEG